MHWFTLLTGDRESDARRVRRHLPDARLEIQEKHSVMAANAAQGFDFGALIDGETNRGQGWYDAGQAIFWCSHDYWLSMPR